MVIRIMCVNCFGELYLLSSFQVLYLDSIDLGELNMPHTIFPWAQCFTADRMKAMAAADVVRVKSGDRMDPVYGASKVISCTCNIFVL